MATDETPTQRPETAETSEAEAVRYRRVRLNFYIIAAIIGAGLIVIFTVRGLGAVADALNTAFISLLLVFFLRKPVAYMQQHHIGRTLGSVIALLAVLAVLTLIGFIIIPPLTQQLTAFVKAVPNYIGQVVDWGNSLSARYSSLASGGTAQTFISQIGSSLTSWLSDFSGEMASKAVDASVGIGHITIVILMALVAAFWFLRDLPTMTREVNVLIPEKHSSGFHAVVSICSHVADGYIKGMILSALVTGVLAWIGFAIVGLPYATILAFLTGILKFIPIVGPWIAGAAAGIVGLFVSPLECVLSILISVVAQQVCDIFIMPRIMQSSVDLHPALVIIALMIGAGIGGIGGMVLSVPVIAAAKGIFVYYFEQRTGRQLVTPDGALFEGTPRGTDVNPANDAAGSVESQRMQNRAKRLRERIGKKGPGGSGGPGGTDADA